MKDYYIGIMSGTSMDAVDATIINFHHDIEVIAHFSLPFPEHLHHDISALITCQHSTLANLGYLDVALAEVYVNAVQTLLDRAAISAHQITAIGCHGQTVFHQPDAKYRFSTQLGSGSYIAEKTLITTVTDFRNRDMAAGGQGAPLVPAFLEAYFTHENNSRLIINIGGISNCTWLPTRGETIGYDIGPGNTLMDCWIHQCCNKPFDKDGHWAASGNISEPLLNKLLEDEYFQRSSPKSTGRELFNLDWLQRTAGELIKTLTKADIQATLLQLTAHSIAQSIRCHQPDQTFFYGGGVHNKYLMEQIKRLSGATILDMNELGISPDWVEAAAFAWIARRCIKHQTGTLSAVTGATHPVISGAIYPVA